MNATVATFGISSFVAKRSDHSLVEQLPQYAFIKYVGRSVSLFEDRVEFDVQKTGFTKYIAPLFGPMSVFIAPQVSSLSGTPLKITARWENVRQVTWQERRRGLTVWGTWELDNQLWSCTIYLSEVDFGRLVAALRGIPAAAHALASAPAAP